MMGFKPRDQSKKGKAERAQRVVRRIIKGDTVEVLSGAGEEEPQPDEMDDSDDKAMEEASKDFADGDKGIKLYRYQEGQLGGRPSFLGELMREEFTETFVAQRFGGGRFFGRWQKKDGVYVRYPFQIEGEPLTPRRDVSGKEEREESEVYGSPMATVQPTEDGRLSTMDVLRMIAETRREAREEMRMLLEIMKPAANPPSSTEQVFSLVEKIVPLIQGGGNGDGGNPWLFALAQLKDPLMKIVDTIQTAVTKPTVAAQAPPGAPVLRSVPRSPQDPPIVSEPAKSTAEVVQPTEGEMLADSFKEYLPMLCKAASQDKDPALYCDLILDQVPVFAYSRLRKWLVSPGCLDDLAKFAPIISADPQQRAWWIALQGCIIHAINEELGDAPSDLQPKPHSDAPGSGPADSNLVS